MNKRIFLSLLLLSTTSLFARGSWHPSSALFEPSFEIAPPPSELFEETVHSSKRKSPKVFYYGKGELIPVDQPCIFPTVGISVRPTLSRFATVELDANLFSILIVSIAQVSVCPLVYITDNFYLRAGVGGRFIVGIDGFISPSMGATGTPVFPFSIGYQTSTIFIDGGIDVYSGDSLQDISHGLLLPTLRLGKTF